MVCIYSILHVCVLYCIYFAYMSVCMLLHLFCNYFWFVDATISSLWMVSLMLQHLDA